MRSLVILFSLATAYIALKQKKIGRSVILLLICLIEVNVISQWSLMSKAFSQVLTIVFFFIVTLVLFINGYDWKLEQKIHDWFLKHI